MTNEQIRRVLRDTKISSCTPIIPGHIYHCNKRSRCNCERPDGTRYHYYLNYEILIITNGEEKQGIIVRIAKHDLYWFVFKKWRNQHVLSNALRTGVIHDIWEENKEISCCYDDYDEDAIIKKYNMTKHLADIAGLHLRESWDYDFCIERQQY